MTAFGVILFAAAAAFLAWNLGAKPRRRPYPRYGYGGWLLIAGATALRALGVELVALYFTPLLWTGYILIVDAGIYRLRGSSWLVNNRVSFAWAALLSIPLWLVFEAYNLRLRNWAYQGLPESLALRCVGYFWSFATIWPAVLETAELLLAGRMGGDRKRSWRLPGNAMLATAAAALVLPLVVPPAWGAYLFGLVWVGFALLLDPLNRRAGRASIAKDLEQGRRARMWALLAAGLICGFFWEFWNIWAAARWVYIFPILQGAKIFEMPVLGYLGFPAFALEVFAMYVYVASKLDVPCYVIGEERQA